MWVYCMGKQSGCVVRNPQNSQAVGKVGTTL